MKFPFLHPYPMLPASPASGTPPSPCLSQCQINPLSGLCQGCLRTLPEIIHWSEADDAFKWQVWAAIKEREALLDFD